MHRIDCLMQGKTEQWSQQLVGTIQITIQKKQLVFMVVGA